MTNLKTMETQINYYLNTLTDEDILKMRDYLGVDYSHTTWEEEKRMIIEDVVCGMDHDSFNLDNFCRVMSYEEGKPVEARLAGTAILYNSTDKTMRGYTSIKDYCESALKLVL